MRNFFLGFYIAALMLVTIQDTVGLEGWIAFERKNWVNVPPVVWLMIWSVTISAIVVGYCFREEAQRQYKETPHG